MRPEKETGMSPLHLAAGELAASPVPLNWWNEPGGAHKPPRGCDLAKGGWWIRLGG